MHAKTTKNISEKQFVIRISGEASVADTTDTTADTTDTTDATDATQLPRSLEQLTNAIAVCQKELTDLITGTLLKAVELGDLLLTVRQLLPHGSFLKWVDSELYPSCGVKRRTAQRYMHLARNRDLLLERLAETSSPAEILEANSAASVKTLASLKMSDGERLIQEQQNRHTQSAPGFPEYLDDVMRSFGQETIGKTFIQKVFLPSLMLPTFPHDIALLGVSTPKLNEAAVQQLSVGFRPAETTAALLWINSHRMERWVAKLNAFPRVCIRTTDEKPQPSQLSWWLYGLVIPKHVSAFTSAVHRLGDVLVPYSPSRNSSQTLPE